MRICGIYAIENIISQKLYIGKSINVKKRILEHKRKLKNNVHFNKYLQKSWLKYGFENFKFKIIEECLEHELDEKEIYFIEKFKTITGVYNFKSGGNGGKHSYETKEKIKEKRKNQIITQETKLKMKKSRIGKKPNKGKKFSDEHKEKIKKAMKNRRLSEEHRAKISEANRRREVTKTTREKMSMSKKNKKISEETKMKIGNSNRGENHNLAKLNEVQVNEIRENKENLSCSKAGKKYGVSASHINNIRRGRMWKHLNKGEYLWNLEN